MKLIKKLTRQRFQENCAFAFILFQIRIYVHLQCVTGLLLTVAWDQALLKGQSRKKIMAKQSEPSGSLGRGKGGRRPPFPPPQSTARLPSLADLFFLFHPFFCAILPQCGAWSQAI